MDDLYIWKDFIDCNPENSSEVQWAEYCVEKMKTAVKFSLPNGGITILDKNLGAIREKGSICLPFDEIVIEYERDGYFFIFFACEMDTKIEGTGEVIVLSLFAKDKAINKWGAVGQAYIEKEFFSKFVFCNVEKGSNNIHMHDLSIFLYFINALCCSNVSYEKRYYKTSETKPSSPDDEYRVLVIKNKDGSSTMLTGEQNLNRSGPREHIRRGHFKIKRNGSKIWTSSCVVSKGSKGRIFKDYEVKLH